MNYAARRVIDESTDSLFLAACTSTPVTEDVLFAVQQIAMLLEEAIFSDDSGELRAALENYDTRQSRSADLYACAVQTLADTLPAGVEDLRAFIHRAAQLERKIFGDDPMNGESPTGLPFVYVS